MKFFDPSVTELSNTEADDREEEMPEAVPAGDAAPETQSKKRKRKAQSKKQLKGEQVLLSHQCALYCTCFSIVKLPAFVTCTVRDTYFSAFCVCF